MIEFFYRHRRYRGGKDIMTTTTAQPKIVNGDIIRDGRHKRGGAVYAVNRYTEDGEYVGRTTLGVVWKRNAVAVAHDPSGDQYASNDWTAPQDEAYQTHPTRKAAMDRIREAAARL